MFSRKKEKQEPYTKGVNARLSESKIKEILTTVRRDKAFCFYEGIDKPIGHIATSLLDFRNKINTVQLSSLVFHLKRKDFENWIREIIRDSEMAKRISNINPNDFALKNKLYTTVDTRIKELKAMLSTSTTISENRFITPRFTETELSR
ncbi:hypothetical protein KAU55_05570 [Candidatus Bathyarchaeota archaeon]|nr:hypothetical protein [Candidatus Bathyarchaeota archaeon]